MGHVVQLPDEGRGYRGDEKGEETRSGTDAGTLTGHPAYPRHGMGRVGNDTVPGDVLGKGMPGEDIVLVPAAGQMRPGPSSAPAITSGASRPAGICFSPSSITRLATSHSRRPRACAQLSASALPNCPAKTWANVAYRTFSGVSGARAGSVPTFPRGTSCPRLFIRAWTAEPPGRPGPPGSAAATARAISCSNAASLVVSQPSRCPVRELICAVISVSMDPGWMTLQRLRRSAVHVSGGPRQALQCPLRGGVGGGEVPGDPGDRSDVDDRPAAGVFHQRCAGLDAAQPHSLI